MNSVRELLCEWMLPWFRATQDLRAVKIWSVAERFNDDHFLAGPTMVEIAYHRTDDPSWNESFYMFYDGTAMQLIDKIEKWENA
jgi:hypothetical protein